MLADVGVEILGPVIGELVSVRPPVGECLNREGLLRLQQDDTIGKAIKIGVHDEQLVTPR